ncbi:geranylgeranyl transferase type-1 subunit beta [Arachis duranensis]|uniref:Geranylgeranyl transferase type-1 subunit beta n=1 Tax=Arachis duranensis TaxID=130453 RepID=A0A6P4D8G9_ARADU|nr:geranylgeranyl transferase type-1 subunit beta [Arachis duranensis]
MDSTEESSPTSESSNTIMDMDLHNTFAELMFHLLPSPYESQEINHLTLAYFVISSLDILNSLNRVEKDAIVDWVLSFQFHPGTKTDPNNGQFYGFHGSRTSQFPPDDNGVLLHNHSYLASTYCALAILKIVGYDLSNVDSELMLASMRNLQQPDGSFMAIHIGGETDLRFVYCAAAICFMLDNWSGMDKEKAKDYILNCQSYDGGFGLVPGAESHGGATYCAIASLRLMGFIEDNLLSSCASSLIDVPLLLDWIVQRQGMDGGFQGRTNKTADTCYAFWIGAVLKILGAEDFVDIKALHRFLLTCQYKYGGFSKFPGEFPDLYHSYYGFAAFSLLKESGLKSLCCELGITETAAKGL